MGAVFNRYLQLPTSMKDYEWQDKGNCVGKDVNMFYHPYNERGEEKIERLTEAKAICVGCPVIAECLNHALSVPEHFGVWGGMSEDERRLLLRRRKRKKDNS